MDRETEEEREDKLNTIGCYVPSYCYFTPPPFISNENVARLVKSYYPITNVNPQSIKFLGGYDDHNYYVKGSLVDGNNLKEFIFKVMVENDSNYYDAVTKLMLHLNKEGINASLPVKSINNNFKYAVPLKRSLILQQEVEDDTDYTGLLLTYLPGNILSSVQRSPKLLYDAGVFVGKLNTVLQKFSHPYWESRHFIRDLKNFLEIKPYMKYADDAREKEYFEYAFRVYSEHVMPNLSNFQRGTIHNDLNEDNFVCTNEGANHERFGLIDFSDTVSSYTVFDGAIFITYMMMLDCTNPLEYAEPAVAGYLNACHLNEHEFDCLYYLVVCHLTQSTLLALRSSVVFPDNLYRTRTLHESRTALKMLLKTPKQEVDRRWREAQQKAALKFRSLTQS